LLQAQVQREQDFNTGLHTIQQQAKTEKTELSQHHQTQLQEIQRQHEEHERLTTEQIQALNDTLQQWQSDSVTRVQDIVNQLLAQREANSLALTEVNTLEQQLTNLRLWEKQLRTSYTQQAEHAETLAQRITDIQSTWLWRLNMLFHPARWPNITTVNKIDLIDLSPEPSMQNKHTTDNHHQAVTTQHFIDKNIISIPSAIPPLPTREFSTMLPAQHICELFIFDEREFINAAYLTLLGREPDPNGMNYYQGRLRMGYSKASIIAQIAKSAEALPHENIKGLTDLIKQEQQVNHWFWGLFGRSQRIERLMQKNGEELSRTMDVITQLKTTLQTLSAAIDTNAQSIQVSLAQLTLQASHVPIQSTVDNLDNTTSDERSDLEGLKQLTPRARDIYFQLKKAVAHQSVRAA